jgi:CheY-like chemotaxis protein
MRLRIIVVDDEEVIRDVLKDFFTALGHEVLTSTEPLTCPIYTGGECPCAPGEVCGDFLITDNRMPRMSGIQFIQNQIRAGCKGITANKAIMSASFTDDELEQVRRLECRVFLKPFSLAEIEKWVNENRKNIDPDRRLRDL